MIVYLDNCCFNRPFDDQKQLRIRLETQAKLSIQGKIRDGSLSLVWSFILSYELSANPFRHRRNQIAKMEHFTSVYVHAKENVYDEANKIMKNCRISPKDALHLAAAIDGHAEYFITTDDRLIRNTRAIEAIRIIDPLDFIKTGEQS